MIYNVWIKYKLISNRKKLGKVWLVKKWNGPICTKGYYKHTNNTHERYVGPLAANEYIAYKLGRRTGLPMGKVEFVNLNGQSGIVSYRKQGKLLNWLQLRKKNTKPFKYISHPARLLNMFVFDVWIGNIDRNNKNIILYSKGKRYDFYLIDHGLSLLGAITWKKRYWNSSYWHSVAAYNRRYLKGLPNYIIKNKQHLQHYIRKIQSISDQSIDYIVNTVPPEFLNVKQKYVIRSFLKQRKKRLHQLIKRWLIEYQKK